MINDYKLFHRDRNWHGGGILCYINENVLPPVPPKKTTTTTTAVDVESIEKDFKIVLIELFIKIRKWLCIGLYKLSSQNENNFLDNISLLTNKLPGDFNMTIENKNL